MPAEMQVALLRVLQEHEFERVGGTQPFPVDVRSSPRQTAIWRGRFAREVSSRSLLSVEHFSDRCPPLARTSRRHSVARQIFHRTLCGQMGKRIRSIEKRTAQLLKAYYWPGNIRELQNVIERSTILCDSETFFVEEESVQPEMETPEYCDRALQARNERLSRPLGREPWSRFRPAGSRPETWSATYNSGIENQEPAYR